MLESDVLEIFKEEKALLSGHFLLSSGLHSPHYMQCALVLQKPWVAQKLCQELAKKLKSHKIDAVIGPALGGMIVSYEMGRALKVRSLFAERVDGSFVLRRGFSLKRNERLLVVEDVITTGGSTREVMKVVEEAEGRLVGVGALIDRSGGTARFPVKKAALATLTVPTYKPEDCPLCKAGTPAVKPGSRAAPKG